VFRPDDLEPVAAGPAAIPVTVTAVEYGGREFHFAAATAAGVPLLAMARRKVAIGERLSVGIAPERVLLFAEDAR
jgi:hypothetical protein